MSGEHSKWAPSASERWLSCPGCLKLAGSLGIEEETSEYAKEGTSAHALAADCLARGTQPLDYLGDVLDPEAGYPVTREMAAAVQEYLDFMRARMDAEKLRSKKQLLSVECKFDLSWLWKDLFGTSDAWLFDQDEKALYVVDYKHGQGVSVQADWNPQLMIYGLGAAHELYVARSVPVFTLIDKVHFTIVQPRVYGEETLRQWSTTIKELYHWGLHIMRPAAQATTEEDAPRRPGDHCRFCEASAICPEKGDMALALAKTEFTTTMFPDPNTLTPEDVLAIKEKAGAFKHWVESVEAFMLKQMEAGIRFPGYKLVKKKANRVWVNEAVAEEAFKKHLGNNIFKPQVMRSVAQMEKALKEIGQFDAEQFQQFYDKPDNGLSIAPESDRRKEIDMLAFYEDLDVLQ